MSTSTQTRQPSKIVSLDAHRKGARTHVPLADTGDFVAAQDLLGHQEVVAELVAANCSLGERVHWLMRQLEAAEHRAAAAEGALMHASIRLEDLQISRERLTRALARRL